MNNIYLNPFIFAHYFLLLEFMLKKAVISLGSNKGVREKYLIDAIYLITENIGRVTQESSIHETSSWGFESHPFLNQVIEIETSFSPLDLLHKLQTIEKTLGRVAKTKVEEGKPMYEDRTIDLDILFYEGVEMSTTELTIPHPHINEREFVLVPMRELTIDYK